MKKSPEEIYGDLYFQIQKQKIFSDGKVFSDADALMPADQVLQAYEFEKDKATFDLRAFVLANFKLPNPADSGFETDPNDTIETHIEKLWDVLKRDSDDQSMTDRSSLIPLPFPYIVPGGRFNEIYYWDSYFTMLGLKESGRVDLIVGMIQNFAWMIEQFGFIPNGNRSYFLGRSQPPFFSLMVRLLESIKGFDAIREYIPIVEKEYKFWAETPRYQINDELALFRYWDDHDTARGEMLGDDLELLSKSGRDDGDLFRHVRAACESGWDFSSRWFDKSNNLDSIQCADIFPVDLNCLIYQLCANLADWYGQLNNVDKSSIYFKQAEQLQSNILNHLWSTKYKFFMDYNQNIKYVTGKWSLAGVYPLFFNIANQDQAKYIAEILEKTFLKDGGWVTTPIETGEQWDAPNGWAPLQWMCYIGLKNYGFDELANEAKSRWLKLNEDIFRRTGKMLEKYNVVNTSSKSGGGEYPVQDGFGWTNGVYLAMKNS